MSISANIDPSLPKNLRILLVGAHPADAFDNAGGTLVHHIERGDEVTCVVMTHGVRSHANVLLDELQTQDREATQEEVEEKMQYWAREKNREVLAACEIMGISDVRFLVMDDDVMLLDAKLIRQVGDIILDVRPDLIITHYPYEGGGIANPHATTGQTTMHALYYALAARQGDARKRHRVGQVYYMGIPAGGVSLTQVEARFHPTADILVDCSDVIERKIRALDQIKSQRYDGPYARKRVETVDGHFGRAAGVAYAEPFMRDRPELFYHLPYTQTQKNRCQQTQSERFAELTQMLGGNVPYEGEH
ncbi:MAG: PIG-L deacetylase family protein [Chthoniobacterales bacterium]